MDRVLCCSESNRRTKRRKEMGYGVADAQQVGSKQEAQTTNRALGPHHAAVCMHHGVVLWAAQLCFAGGWALHGQATGLCATRSRRQQGGACASGALCCMASRPRRTIPNFAVVSCASCVCPTQLLNIKGIMQTYVSKEHPPHKGVFLLGVANSCCTASEEASPFMQLSAAEAGCQGSSNGQGAAHRHRAQPG